MKGGLYCSDLMGSEREWNAAVSSNATQMYTKLLQYPSLKGILPWQITIGRSIPHDVSMDTPILHLLFLSPLYSLLESP